MDQLTPVILKPKQRRRFTPEFKQQVLDACEVPGQSVASVAHQFDLNANLLHKWRRTYRVNTQTDFVRLPASITPPASSQSGSDTTVRIELPDGVVAHWPTSAIDQSIPWLKALMQR